MKKYILTLNAGSSTLKFGYFTAGKDTKLVKSGNFERIGLKHPFLTIGQEKKIYNKKFSYNTALKEIIKELKINENELKVIGHRVVHGGDKYYKPTIVTKKIWKDISQFNDLAPLHNPANLEIIKLCFKQFPKINNVAVFDTGFFNTFKPSYFHYAIPYEYYEKLHIRRYGFHGISHEAVAHDAARRLKKKFTNLNLITVHLGSGSSITAIKNGRPIKTSLGFTPLEGLVMGTRPGDLDAAIPLFLQKKLNKSPDQVENIITKKSGLLGLSGFTSDMREILKAAGKPVIDYHGPKKFTKIQKKRAKLAFGVFMINLQQFMILYTALLGRIDAIVFTGGIGERSPIIRKMSLQGIKFKKRPKIFIIKSNEEKAIADKVKNIV